MKATIEGIQLVKSDKFKRAYLDIKKDKGESVADIYFILALCSTNGRVITTQEELTDFTQKCKGLINMLRPKEEEWKEPKKSEEPKSGQ